jgi:hypothetical protein
MKGWRAAPVAFVALLVLVVGACGGGGPTAAVSSGPAIGPGWLKVSAFSGRISANGWTYAPAVHLDGGTARVVGTATSDDPTDVGFDIGLVRGLKPRADGTTQVGIVPGPLDGKIPVRAGVLSFDWVTNGPLRPGIYRFAIMSGTGRSGSYTVTLYVKE